MAKLFSTSLSNRNRRTTAVLTWVGLTVAAALLWYCRVNQITQSVASESVAIMLSAYTCFVSIFAWMLFAPNQRDARQSPVLFLSGAFTLFPPCIIAFFLMPPDSPLRLWLSFGLLALGFIAILSPVPEGLFAVPRGRQSYLRPITDTMFSDMNVLDVGNTFERMKSAVREQTIAGGNPVNTGVPVEARDPWSDPFRGTGIQPAAPNSNRRLPLSSTPAQRDNHRSGQGTTTSAQHHSSSSAVIVSPPPVPRQTPAVSPASASDSTGPLSTLPPPPIPISASPPHVAASPVAERSRLQLDSPPPAAPVQPVADSLRLTHDRPEYDRIRDESGRELIEGTVRVTFEPGQKRANIHIPFQPPLAGIPDVECEGVGDEALRVKVPVRQSYGIRIEARRVDATAALDTEIGFSAVYSPPNRRL
ncbi:MAG: hypothetical protein KDA85_03090 [Planctomycetaceae bacterium]|nr:hypothetical protein [Planctomycetaceae bacterium]